MIKNLFFENKTKSINIITLCCITAFMLFLNFNCGYISDDYHFRYVWVDVNPRLKNELIDSFSDILVSMSNYYNLSGGRVLCHFIAYCLLTLDKAVFNIINSLMFTALGWLTYLYVKKSTGSEHMLFLPIIYYVFLFFLPKLGDNCLWMSGSINYLWSTVILILCFLQINTYAEKSETSSSAKSLFVMCILILISSLTNETTGGMLILFMLITFVLEHKFKPRYIVPFIPAIIGTLLVTTAPGNKHRSSYIVFYDEDMYTFKSIIQSLLQYLNYIFDKYFVGIVLIIFVLILSFAAHKKLRDIIIDNKLFITGTAGILVLSVLGYFAERPIFPGAATILAGFFISAIKLCKIIADINKRSDMNYSLIRKLIIELYISVSLVWILSVVFNINKTDIILTVSEIFFLGLLSLLIIYAVKKSYNDPKELSSIKTGLNKLKNIAKKLPAVIILVMLIPVTVNSIKYINAANERKVWLEESETAIVNGNFEDFLFTSCYKNDTGVFYPQESTNNDSSPFSIAWRAADHDIYIYAYHYEEEYNLKMSGNRNK